MRTSTARMSRSSSVISAFPADDNLNRRLPRAGVLHARQLGVQIRRRHDGVFRQASVGHTVISSRRIAGMSLRDGVAPCGFGKAASSAAATAAIPILR